MKRLLITIPTIFLGLLTYSQTDADYNSLERLLRSGNCDQLLTEADRIRSDTYGKNPLTDYYLGQAYCCKGMYEVAKKAFSFIEREHKTDDRLRSVVNRARNSCTPSLPVFTANSDDFVGRMVIALLNEEGDRSRVGGKIRSIRCDDPAPRIEIDPTFDPGDYAKRLFDLDEKQKAIAFYDSLLPQYHVNAHGRFIFITRSENNEVNFRTAANELERVYEFYHTYYNVRPPNKLIAVYLMGSTYYLREVARETHGFILPEANLGYSNLADLSVLGNSTTGGLGTIKHELFHLMIRTDIGDIPGWLDEGIASMYEESDWDGDKLVPYAQTWRTGALKYFIRNEDEVEIPSLALLIRNNWSEFNTQDAGVSECEVGANYAIAKHFIIFLDENNFLVPMIDAFKNRKSVFTDPSYENEDPIAIVERVMELDIGYVQAHFHQWLQENYHIKLDFDRLKYQNKWD